MRPINSLGAVVLARYCDKPNVPQQPSYYQDFCRSQTWSRCAANDGGLLPDFCARAF